MRRSRPRFRLALSIGTLTAGVALAVGVPLWWMSRSPAAPSVTAVHPGAVQRLAEPRDPSPTAARRIPEIPVSRVGGDRVTSTTGPAPRRVVIPAIGVDATVRPEGVAADGQMAIPADIHQVGWFRWSSPPGSASGSVVLVGHLDSADQPGLGAFAYLRTLGAGDRVNLTTAHRVWHYRVVSREAFAKSALPLGDIFGRTGRPRLTLVTCGGHFDATAGGYDDNIVVTAVPAWH